MSEFTSTSGAKVHVRVAPFKDSMALKNAITKELSTKGIDLSTLTFKDENGKDKKIGDIDTKELLSPIVNSVLALDSSDEVYRAVFKCLERCTYNGEKITENTFEDVEARGDYYEILLSCLKENIFPFFGGLRSKFKDSGLTIENLLK